MEILLVGINSKYTHSNLAIRCLEYYAKSDNVKSYESNINVDINKTLNEILSFKSDVIGFSCYIFNAEYVQKLIGDIKSLCPDVKIITGGPQPLKGDIRIDGEGEKAFKNFLTGENEVGFIDMDELYGMYDSEYINRLKGRTLYYEASRGCPFSCAYCLSGIDERVRYKSIDVVKKELRFFSDMNVPQVKFVDRTFNANKKFCCEILRFILEEKLSCTFHFEMAGDLFTDDMIQIINKFPVGQLEFEIGLQSFNQKTLSAATRKSDLEAVQKNIRALMNIGNCHLHADLIAGLPLEDFASFKNSFNKCYALRCNYLQVGFLKVLPNSRLKDTADKYGVKYRDYAPYEVLATDCITSEELYQIKYVENAVSKYYNCAGFKNTLLFLEKKFQSPFDFYLTLGKHISGQENISHVKKYEILLNLFGNEILDLLRFDFLLTHNTQNLIPSLFISFDDECKAHNKNKELCCVKLDVFGGQKTILFDRTKIDSVTKEYAYSIKP